MIQAQAKPQGTHIPLLGLEVPAREAREEHRVARGPPALCCPCSESWSLPTTTSHYGSSWQGQPAQGQTAAVWRGSGRSSRTCSPSLSPHLAHHKGLQEMHTGHLHTNTGQAHALCTSWADTHLHRAAAGWGLPPASPTGKSTPHPQKITSLQTVLLLHKQAFPRPLLHPWRQPGNLHGVHAPAGG